MEVRNGLDTLQEGARNVPEAIKARALNTLHNGYETLRGSGSLPQELSSVARSYLNIPGTALGTALRASGDLLTFQPLQATRAVAGGLLSTLRDIGNIVTSPSRVAVAGVGTAARAVGSVAALPLRAPMAACRVVGNGCSSLMGMLKS